MPIYQYRCADCGEEHEALKKVDERSLNQCPYCMSMAEQILTPVHFDPRMGVDPDFPTAYAAWGKKHRALNEGRMKDPNAAAHGTTVDIEKDQFNARKRAGQ